MYKKAELETEKFTDDKVLKSGLKMYSEWSKYTFTAKGTTLTNKING